MAQLKRYTVATLELLLVFPAGLFMAALFVRNLQPLQYEPARTAQQIVNWYAARPRFGLWVLLIVFPLMVLATGCATIFRAWTTQPELRQEALEAFGIIRKHRATVLISGATMAAACFLTIVALHLLTD